MTNIEDLRSRVKVLLELLNAPEPGLTTWRESYEHASANVLAFWGYGSTQPVSLDSTCPLCAANSLFPEMRRLTFEERENLGSIYRKLFVKAEPRQ